MQTSVGRLCLEATTAVAVVEGGKGGGDSPVYVRFGQPGRLEMAHLQQPRGNPGVRVVDG